ncbi:MAG: UDP-2,3-diacylglucosamine diphosphatase LpxI [Candidatus Devosia symbiotica]|nr:UDP-2,3-diacylglucosamine diphosphatase LpxI [Candidatus Devosia symbiotica]
MTPREAIAGVKMIAIDLDNPLRIIWSLKVFRTTHIAMAGGIHLPDKAREELIRFANGNAPAGEGMADTCVGDAVLAALGKVLKKITGADLVGVHELSPELLAQESAIAGPGFDDGIAALFALETAQAIGALDIGQAAIVSGRRIITVENIGGTDALIDRVGTLRTRGLTGDGSAPLVLAKAMQLQQSVFVDLPAIGPETVTRCAAADIAAIVAEAGHSLVLQRDELSLAAEQHSVAVLGLRIDHG